ncbi:MAG: crotonase/enoyl-CoA hydratase family protein [Pseudomonadota bacterium]
MTEHIGVEIADGVAELRMQRPAKKNALTDAMYHAMADAMAAADADDGVGAVLFLGVEGTFTAGNDVADFLAQSESAVRPTDRGVVRFLQALTHGQTPLVAGVDGLAVGIGTTLLFQCDLVVASDRSLFLTPFTDLGLVPENASSYLGPRIMGYQRAFEMLCLGEAFDATRAESAGFVNRVVAPERLEKAARDLARRLAAKPRQAMRASRNLLRPDGAARHQAIEVESEVFGDRLRSAEAHAAFAAFMAKKAS